MKVVVSRERLYRIWSNMHERCENPSNVNYKYYGGRGISVCEEWGYYSRFCAWAYNNGYSDEYSLDRINVNGNYEPRNCRWATVKEQANNKRTNKYVDYGGMNLTFSEWADITSVDKRNIAKRITRGWKPEEAIGVNPHLRVRKINLRNRGDKWEYRFEAPRTHDGVRHHISKCGFPTREEALEAGKRKCNEVYVTKN